MEAAVLIFLLSTLYLAQSADEGIGILNKLIAGGPALIFAALCVLLGYFAYNQLKANNELEKSFREKIEANANKHQAASETLLREMLERDREALEGTTAAVKAVETFTAALKAQRASCDEVSSLVRDMNHTLAKQWDQIRSLEDELRRSRNA